MISALLIKFWFPFAATGESSDTYPGGNLYQRLSKGDGPKKKWPEKKEGVRIGTEEEEILLSRSVFPLLFSSALYTSRHSPLSEIRATSVMFQFESNP